MIAIMGIATQQKIMGRFVIGVRLKWLGWLATGVMAAAALAFGLFSMAEYFKLDW